MGDISVVHGELAARGERPDQPSPDDKLKASLRALAVQMRLLHEDESSWTVRAHDGISFAYISTNGEFGGKMHSMNLSLRNGQGVKAHWIGSETMVLENKPLQDDMLENIANAAGGLTQRLVAENNLKRNVSGLVQG